MSRSGKPRAILAALAGLHALAEAYGKSVHEGTQDQYLASTLLPSMNLAHSGGYGRIACHKQATKWPRPSANDRPHQSAREMTRRRRQMQLAELKRSPPNYGDDGVAWPYGNAIASMSETARRIDRDTVNAMLDNAALSLPPRRSL